LNNIVLSNESLRLEFAPDTGALVGLSAVETGWTLLDRPHVGLSFRLMLPLPGRRNNPVFGEKQTLTSVEAGNDGRSAAFVWDGVTSEYGGHHDVRVSLDVTLTDRQAVYAMTIENGADLVVEDVYCPYLGDVQHPPQAERFRTFLYQYASAQEWPLWPTYQNLRGYYGVDYPTQFSGWSAGTGAPMSPYILLRGANMGLYAGVAAPSSELVSWHTELRPGFSDSLSPVGGDVQGRVPDSPTIAGKDVVTRFAAVHVPYIQPGETRSLTPVALEAYQGGWQ